MYTVDLRFSALAATVMAGAMMLGACAGDATGSRAHEVSLSFTTRSSTALRATSGVRSDMAVGPAGELVLKRIQLVIDRVELSPSAGGVCSDDEGDDDRGGNDNLVIGASLRGDDKVGEGDDCEDLARDPLLVDVPVDDAVHTVITVPVPAGTYSRLEAKLDPASSSDIAALGAPSDMIGRSVRVEGTFKGAPFIFTSPLETSLEFEFNPPLVVDGSGKNATLNIDVTRWFIAANGAVIDPAGANPGGVNAGLVANNIRASFRAFEDDDRQGDSDIDAQKDGNSGHGGGDR